MSSLQGKEIIITTMKKRYLIKKKNIYIYMHKDFLYDMQYPDQDFKALYWKL